MTITEQLEAARKSANVTYYKIARDTGLAYMTVRGVFDGKDCLMSNFDTVALYLNLRPVLMTIQSLIAKRIEDHLENSNAE